MKTGGGRPTIELPESMSCFAVSIGRARTRRWDLVRVRLRADRFGCAIQSGPECPAMGHRCPDGFS